MLYAYVKSFHIIFVIAFMAGMLYLPRIFAYRASDYPEGAAVLTVMARRLLRIIINPSMFFMLLTGLYLMFILGEWHAVWFHVKMVCVFLLLCLHAFFAVERKRIARNAIRTSLFYKVLNEFVTFLMVLIVIFVVVKPFS